jgi:hypothetical protein
LAGFLPLGGVQIPDFHVFLSSSKQNNGPGKSPGRINRYNLPLPGGYKGSAGFFMEIPNIHHCHHGICTPFVNKYEFMVSLSFLPVKGEYGYQYTPQMGG